MPRPTPSPSATAPSSHKHRKRKVSRARIQQCLDILGPLGPLLPATLPLSPPTSREASPAITSTKRKLDSSPEHAQSKKPRIASTSTTTTPADSPASTSTSTINTTTTTTSHRPPLPRSTAPPVPSTSAASSSRLEPSEEGEVTEDTPAFHSSLAVVSNVPVRRPRRGTRLPLDYFDELYNQFHTHGRMLKASGKTRLLSTYPSTHKDHKPLLHNPPTPGTPYHKYGHFIARLEHIDALVHFTYAMWAKDWSRHRCSRDNWSTFSNILPECKEVWRGEDNDERDKAFLGLIYMVEGFMVSRQVRYTAQSILSDDERMLKRLQIEYDAYKARKEAEAALQAPLSQVSILPSPASTTGSTPPSAQGTPNSVTASATSNAPSTGAPTAAVNPPRPAQPEKDKNQLPPNHITIPVHATTVNARRTQSSGVVSAAHCMDQAQRLLTLPVLAKHFPRTFARMMYTSLGVGDESEPDIKDDEGELFWPGQCVTGEGLGWVCLMGASMIREVGKAYGYRGVEAVIPCQEVWDKVRSEKKFNCLHYLRDGPVPPAEELPDGAGGSTPATRASVTANGPP